MASTVNLPLGKAKFSLDTQLMQEICTTPNLWLQRMAKNKSKPEMIVCIYLCIMTCKYFACAYASPSFLGILNIPTIFFLILSLIPEKYSIQ